jgi:hypothetical protein
LEIFSGNTLSFNGASTIDHNRNDKQRYEIKKSNQIKRISIKKYLKKALREEWDGISPDYVKKTLRIHSRSYKSSDFK